MIEPWLTECIIHVAPYKCYHPLESYSALPEGQISNSESLYSHSLNCIKSRNQHKVETQKGSNGRIRTDHHKQTYVVRDQD